MTLSRSPRTDIRCPECLTPGECARCSKYWVAWEQCDRITEEPYCMGHWVVRRVEPAEAVRA